MVDTTTTLEQLKKSAADFVAERDWAQYHSPKNLSMVVSIEASELMEKFLWLTTEESVVEIDKSRQEIEDELADVLLGILSFANAAGIDLSKAFEHKLNQAAKKYPIEKCKGRREKYTKL